MCIKLVLIKELYYDARPKKSQDQTKDGGTNIHECEKDWKAYTQWMMMMMHVGLLVMCVLFLPDFYQNRNLKETVVRTLTLKSLN